MDILCNNVMSKYRQHHNWLAFSILVILMASACSFLNMGKTPSKNAQFDSQPKAVVLYAYIHYPGIPLPTNTPNDRYCEYLPSLIVWGDGFTFLDENIQNQYNSVLSGNLDSVAIQTLLDILNSNNFFSDWQAAGPNPAGTYLKIGAQLKDNPVTEYTSGILEPPVYLQLIETIKPALKPLAEQNLVDKRVDAIMKENENCNEYMYTK